MCACLLVRNAERTIQLWTIAATEEFVTQIDYIKHQPWMGIVLKGGKCFAIVSVCLQQTERSLNWPVDLPVFTCTWCCCRSTSGSSWDDASQDRWAQESDDTHSFAKFNRSITPICYINTGPNSTYKKKFNYWRLTWLMIKPFVVYLINVSGLNLLTHWCQWNSAHIIGKVKH